MRITNRFCAACADSLDKQEYRNTGTCSKKCQQWMIKEFCKDDFQSIMTDTSKMTETEKYNYDIYKTIYDRKILEYKELKKWLEGYEERYGKVSDDK